MFMDQTLIVMIFLMATAPRPCMIAAPARSLGSDRGGEEDADVVGVEDVDHDKQAGGSASRQMPESRPSPVRAWT